MGDPHSDHINAMAKYVVSATLTQLKLEDVTRLDNGIVILFYRVR